MIAGLPQWGAVVRHRRSQAVVGVLCVLAAACGTANGPTGTRSSHATARAHGAPRLVAVHGGSVTVALDQVPTSQLPTVAQQWASLDTYVNTQAYEFVYGYAQLSKFLSNRIDFTTAIFSPIYLNDYSSWQLTS